jgi:cell division protein FtsI (penicillin-binding protein 3)
MGIRFALIIAGFSVLYASLGVRLYDLQITKGEDYAAKAEARHSAGEIFNPIRGNIFFSDKDGGSVPVAVKKDYPYVYCVPKEIADSSVDVKEAAGRLLPLIPGITEEELIGKLGKGNDPYEELAKEVDDATAAAIESLGIEGVKVEKRARRYYPYGALGSHVLGFVSSDGEGKYGLESFYDDD